MEGKREGGGGWERRNREGVKKVRGGGRKERGKESEYILI